jgi:threonine dehydrogenase-like Zn-dependent dehydrogenase
MIGILTVASTNDIVVKEVKVVGSRCGPFPPALKLLADGTIDTDKYLEAEYPLDQWEEALQAAKARGALKVHFICNTQ